MGNRLQDKEKPQGKTIVFYSYKGGVGRTMSLVNIAYLMAKQQKKILLIDWDLEAPGLHAYFPSIKSGDMGLVDMFMQVKQFLLQRVDNNNEEGCKQFLEDNINNYILKDVKENGLKVDIIKAGKFDGDYVDKLNEINWMNFYKECPVFFRTFAQFLEAKYDYILIDSRTGLADTSGICTMLMPQILVLVFSLNHQNLNGVVDVARQSIAYRHSSFDFRNISILPLPSRIDEKNYYEYKKWMSICKEKFETFFIKTYHLDDCNLDNYFNLAKIPYNPSYAYGENIPTLNENVEDDLFISYHYAKFLKLVESKEQIWEILTQEQEENKSKAKFLVESGQIAYNSRQYKNAYADFEKAYHLYPSNDKDYYEWKINLLYQWGNTFFDLAKLEDTKSWFEEGYKKYEEAMELDNYQDSSILINKHIRPSFCNYEMADLILSIPKEIKKQGSVAITSYLEALTRESAQNLNEARIIILGEKGSGKSCLARRLINPEAPMTTDEESTAGVDTILWKPEEANINVHIWDFAGHTVTNAVHQFFLSERCLYILVYDGRTEERNRLEYWLNHVKNYGGDSKVFILINKRDENIPDIPINSLKENYPVLGFTVFSIKDDKKELDDFRKIVTEYIKNNPSWSNQVIPANYFKVKKNLEQRFTGDKKDEFINIDEFVRIAKDNYVENVDELLKSLHALGICLRYDNMKDFNMLVLNPEWISHGVYKIIYWVHQQGRYSIFLTDFPFVFKNDEIRYPVDKHPFLFELMKRYELAYETEQKNCLIIPHLLQEDRPYILPDFHLGESLMLRYKADQPLPPNTISRFFVRHNEEIVKHGNEFLVWRYGVVLDDGNSSMALVREWKDERMITVSVKGENKTAYLDKLRETLNEIFNSYKSMKPELQYGIERFGQIPDETVKDNFLWLSDRTIFAHYVNKRPYYDAYSDRDIYMPSVVYNYHITINNLITGGQGNLIDSSLRNTFNFHNCNLTLQENLNDLASSLKRKGETEEADTLEDAAKALSEAEKCKTPEEVKKKGIANKLRRIVEDLGDENSKLSKTVKGIKHGISIAQDIAKGYNDIAQWIG